MSKAKMMVVEDEAIVSLYLRTTLASSGYSVEAVAFSGEEAIKIAEETPLDLILMDIGLKGEIDGIEAAKEILRRFKVPSVFLTGYTDEHTVARANKAQPLGFIIKPIESNDFIAVINNALKKINTKNKPQT